MATEANPVTMGQMKQIATIENAQEFFGLWKKYLPNPDIVLKKSGKKYDILEELLTDTKVASSFGSRKAATKSRKWDLVGETVDKTKMEICKSAIRKLNVSDMADSVLACLHYGFKVFEVIMDVDPEFTHEGLTIEFVMPKIYDDPSRWFSFNPNGDVQFKSKSDYLGQPLPPQQFIVIQHQPTYDNPYGIALGSLCLYPVTFKRGGVELSLTFMENCAVPFADLAYPSEWHADQIDEAVAEIAKRRRDGVLAHVIGSTVNVVKPDGSGQSTLFEWFKASNDADIADVYLMQSNTTSSTNTGSFARDKVGKEMTEEASESDESLVEKFVNRVIDLIYIYNFDPKEQRPRFEYLEDEDIKLTLAQRDSELRKQGVKFTEQYYITNYKLKPGDIEISEEKEPIEKTPDAGNGEEDKKESGAIAAFKSFWRKIF